MANQYRKRLMFLMLAPVIAGMILSCLTLSVRKERLVSSDSQDYRIDPDTLLERLEQGKTDIFTPLTATQAAVPSTPGPPVRWSQADYERIVQALFRIVFQESLENWKLVDIVLDVDCANVDRGTYTDAQFRFFKIIHTRQEESKIERNILILPLKRLVSWDDQEWYPKVTDWTPLNLAQFKISAEEALQIAEKNGGSEARGAVENACTITTAAGLVRLKGWNTFYTPSDNNLKTLFDVDIDPVSGEITRVKR